MTTSSDEGGWNVARICGSDDAQGAFTAAFIAKNFVGKKVAVIDDKSAYGKGLADVLRKGLEAAGATLALRESYTAGEKDYTALVSEMPSLPGASSAMVCMLKIHRCNRPQYI